MDEVRIAIPYCYYWFCRESPHRRELYWDYAKSFLKKYHPNLHLVRLEPVQAGSQPHVICVRVENEK